MCLGGWPQDVVGMPAGKLALKAAIPAGEKFLSTAVMPIGSGLPPREIQTMLTKLLKALVAGVGTS